MSFKTVLLLGLVLTASARAGKLPSADEAVRDLLPDCGYERETLLLTQAEQSACVEAANQKDVRALVTRYVATNQTGIVGYAYLDKHLVRTLPQTLMVAVDADGSLVGIKVLAFREPAEYIARDGWMEQFRGKTAADEIRMKKNIDGITGATLTARAVTQCARRTLAIHQVLEQQDPK
jgi:Na+-translocating ferredoxin:NAD+ oxidoreductase RnfG subunit